MKKLLFILFLLNLLFITFIKCQDYYPIDPSGKCEKYIGDTSFSPCSKYLINPDSIYMSATTNQTSAMQSLDTYFKLLQSYAGPECQTSYTFRTLCSMFLPECEAITDNSTSTTISIPKRICIDTCSNVTSTCKIPAIFFSCNQTEPFSGLPLFPKSYEAFNLTSIGGQSNYTLDCYNPIRDNSSVVTDTCPFPLIYRNRTTKGNIRFGVDEELGYIYVNEDSLCTVPCPAPIYTDKQWDNILGTSDALSLVSLICCIYLFITYLVINKKRNKYDYFFGFFVSSIILMSIAGSIGFSVGGTRKLICPEPNRRAVSSDPSAMAAGFIFQFAVINAVIWFTINSFELWFQIKFIKKKLELMKFYIPFSLVVSLGLSLPLIGLKEFETGNGNFLVWIDSLRYQNGMFWGPFGGAITLGTCFIGLVIYEIYKIVSSTNRGDVWKLQLKPFLNILLIYLTFIYMFGYNYYIHNSADYYYDSIQEFYLCILKTDGKNCFIKGPPYSSFLMFVFCLRIYGVYCMLLYGWTPKTINIWRNSIILNNSMASKLKSMYNSSGTTRGATSSTDIKMSTNAQSMDSGGGKSSSMEPDEIIIH